MTVYVFYAGEMTRAGARNCKIILADFILRQQRADVVLCINSRGGDVNAGIGLANFVAMLPVALHTHNFGTCSSIAVNVFIQGSPRTADPVSYFSLHAATPVGGLPGAVSPLTNVMRKGFAEKLGWDQIKLDSYFSDTTDKLVFADDAISTGLADAIDRPVFRMGDDTSVVTIPNDPF